MSVIVTETLAVTAELCGSTFSEPAVRMMIQHLSAYPDDAVLNALVRCQKEVRGRLSLAEIISRIDDGRPGAEEAWAMIPRSERDSAVCTEEMLEALGSVSHMLDDEPIPARMAFKEAYDRAVREARSAGKPLHWRVSLGWDKTGREGPILDALKLGRISEQEAIGHIGYTDSGQAALGALGATPDSLRSLGVIKMVDDA